jgi:ribonuclease HII
MPKFDPSLLPAQPDLSFELALWQAGLTLVAGIDEAGRGALAGPVCAAAVILPPDPGVLSKLPGVRDSKQMSPGEREAARELIIRYATAWGVGFAAAHEIDQIGIVPATQLAASRALEALSIPPVHILLDYLFLPEVSVPQTALVKGDCRSLSIAAASVLAKTARDALLRELDLAYPGYGFASHKGYGTLAHRQAIQRLGVCQMHRTSFRLYEADEMNLEIEGQPGLSGNQLTP